MSHDRKSHQEHLAEMGERNVEICIREDLHMSCQKSECQMDNLFFDLSDAEIEGAVRLISRCVHFTPGNVLQLFQHLVRERETRRTLSAKQLVEGH